MSDGKLFAKSKSSELRAELDQAFKKSKPHNRVKIVLKKVIANIILNNNELVNLMPDVIKLMRIDDLEIRKMCFQYLTNYAHHNPKVAHEGLPYLMRFKDDPSPIMRALVIKTSSSVPNKDYVEFTIKNIRKFLKDPDAHVRKTAAYSVCRLYQHDERMTSEENFIDDLNELLYDSNQVVVSNTLAALSYITENGKSLTLTIDKSHAMTLTTYLGKTNEWCQVYILNSLMSYVPQTTNEALDLIDATIPSLQHENSAVVLNAIKVIVYYSNYVKNTQIVMPSIPKRLGTSLVSLLSKPPEIQFLVLRNVILLLLGKKELVNFDVEMFFCRFDDPIYVKDTKLEIIYLLANENNVDLVLNELEEYATEVDVAMARKAIRAFGNLAVKLEGASQDCVEVICDLVSNGISYIVQESAIIIKNILRKYPGKFNFAIDVLLEHYKHINEPDAKIAMIWILGQHCKTINGVRDIFEDFISTFRDDPIEVQYAVLTAVVKLYLQIPSIGEPLVLKILKWATEEVDNPDLRERGFLYWRLISSEENHKKGISFQETTKQIVLNSCPIINADNDNIEPTILEELELNIGTLASIYLKPVQSVFRFSKHKQLQNSPALFERPLPSPPDSQRDTDDQNMEQQNHQKNNNYSPAMDFSDSYPASRLAGSSHDKNLISRDSHKPLMLSRQSHDSATSSGDEHIKKQSLAKRISRKASAISIRGNK